MFANWRIGRPFGIDVFISGWFWLLPLIVFATSFAAGGFDTAAFDTVSLLALFGCVALHELGHALAARGYGIRTRDITLYPIGGVARLERMPERPLAEMVIALAGPAVNVVIALLVGGLLLGKHLVFGSGSVLGGGVVEAFLQRLALGNVVLVVFNMIPAFPMDGGRVLRAFLTLFTSRTTATNIAGGVGTVFAVLFGLYGLATFNLLLVFLAMALFMMGRQEVLAVRQQEEWRRRQTAWAEAEEQWQARWGRGEPAGRTQADGWVFDADRDEWIEYRDGWPVRRFRQQ